VCCSIFKAVKGFANELCNDSIGNMVIKFLVLQNATGVWVAYSLLLRENNTLKATRIENEQEKNS
jgi:hypothetical protein